MLDLVMRCTVPFHLMCSSRLILSQKHNAAVSSLNLVSFTFQEQYVFLHRMMLEALLLGDVTVRASANFADEYKRLQKPQGPRKKGLIDHQYEVDAAREISLHSNIL